MRRDSGSVGEDSGRVRIARGAFMSNTFQHPNRSEVWKPQRHRHRAFPQRISDFTFRILEQPESLQFVVEFFPVRKSTRTREEPH
jgi:hypothetical protein